MQALTGYKNRIHVYIWIHNEKCFTCFGAHSTLLSHLFLSVYQGDRDLPHKKRSRVDIRSNLRKHNKKNAEKSLPITSRNEKQNCTFQTGVTCNSVSVLAGGEKRILEHTMKLSSFPLRPPLKDSTKFDINWISDTLNTRHEDAYLGYIPGVYKNKERGVRKGD